jgi:IS5 family transposase
MGHFGLAQVAWEGESPMVRDRYDPIDVFALVPALSLVMGPVLARLAQRLDDEVLLPRVNDDLRRRAPHTATRGRSSTPGEVLLRMLVVKRLYRWSDEKTEHLMADSLVLRHFCRIYLQPVPDDTTLLRWAHLIGSQTLEELNERVVALARSLKVTRGWRLRVDSMVVETNIHHPTDSRLVGDGVRVLSRWWRRAKRLLTGTARRRPGLFRRRMRSLRRLAQHLHRLARRTAAEAAGQRRAASGQLLAGARQSCRQAERVQARLRRHRSAQARRIVIRLAPYRPLVQQAMRQAQQRILEGTKVPAAEKLLSLFEPHAQVIQRHKPGKPVEFGRKGWLGEVEGGLISEYRIVAEPGPDDPHLLPSLVGHIVRFGKPPELVAGDRGVYTADNEQMAQQLGVKRVVLPSVGRASPHRRPHERTRGFRRGCRFRAGLEGRISVWRRRFGVDQCLDHGEAGLGRWAGGGIVTATLVTIAQTVAGRSARRISRAA